MAKFHCNACETPLVSISIDRGASKITMYSCSRCDTRWWQEDGAPVDRNRVFSVVGARD